MMEFSIVVCTCNGAKRLPLTLFSLKRLVIPAGLSGELIVVDNNSTDGTRAVIYQYSQDLPIPLRYCFEPNQGLAYARNRGIGQAGGQIIIFTDDDCVVDPHWLVEILAEFHADEELMILGGRVELYNKADKPVTLRLLDDQRTFTSAQQLFTLLPGCNMAFRKAVIDGIGLFDVNYGAGRKIPSAEDSDFFYRAYRQGYKMVYFPNVLIYHNHGRRTDAQVKKLNRGYVVGQGAFYCKHLLKGDPTVRRLFINEVKRNIKAMLVNIGRYQVVAGHFKRLHHLMTGFYFQLRVQW